MLVDSLEQSNFKASLSIFLPEGSITEQAFISAAWPLLCVPKFNLNSSVQQNFSDIEMHRKCHLNTYVGFHRDLFAE